MTEIPILYASPRRRPPVALRVASSNPPLESELDEFAQDQALAMFRDELRDTKEIAWRLEATEAAVANGIANARERERAR
jgi:hypothetical protein